MVFQPAPRDIGLLVLKERNFPSWQKWGKPCFAVYVLVIDSVKAVICTRRQSGLGERDYWQTANVCASFKACEQMCVCVCFFLQRISTAPITAHIWLMDAKHPKLSRYVFTCHTCNFLNLIFPWKQFVIRRPLNGKHIIFLKGHRVTHNPPTVPINKMASFSGAFGALGSEGALLFKL